jgi:predicted transglutaminase-like protease
MKLGRISLDLNYIVDMDNDEMVRQATEALYEDLMQGIKYGDLANWIRISEDKDAKEDMIPEFLLEEQND